MRHWRWWVGGTVLVALLALLALALWRRPAAVSLAPAALTIATNTAYLGSCPVLAAQRQGYFTNQQLQVRVLPYSSGKAALAALLAQQADYATVAEIPVMFAALRGAPVQIFSTIYHTGQDHGVVARRDRGIRQASDLAGKRIGVSLSTSAHFALDLLLNRQRLDSDDVQLRNYPPEALLAALQSGEVDAVSGWDPFLGEIEDQLGPLALRFSGPDVYESQYHMVARRADLGLQPQLVQRLLQALWQGGRYCQQHPEQVLALLPRLSPSRRAAMLAEWPAHRFGIELEQSLLFTLEDQARWAVKSGLVSEAAPPNFLDYLYLDGMLAVRPSAVSVLH
ncbi:ABC transporter substrate-binding protein [Pseudoduganella sp. FT55W]|uniref:ABC transporter substrate-binding protein n=1 Tax=Duganella rivi TaxID=2666083 RepID=A0A7X4GS58_9BURK|nr:NrtA/SsuA/CpmA family ABC transporter substrate-binding protein [Duganella rivi]MYM68653.1 ABC transporter substrate-binding protein [Duganella rivi]